MLVVQNGGYKSPIKNLIWISGFGRLVEQATG
jgi:hypothetical protein